MAPRGFATSHERLQFAHDRRVVVEPRRASVGSGRRRVTVPLDRYCEKRDRAGARQK
jgi:hypothetical protein